MRIGVFFNDSNIPTAGGAFTQREAILEALATLKTEHEFYYFFYGKKPTNSVLKNCVPIKGKVLAFILKQLYYFTGFEFFKNMIPLNKKLKEKNIDLLYFLEPNYQPVVVPYIASVWDIAHLYVPFFPEMYKNEEFEKREIMYTRYLRKASYVITTTNSAKEEVEKLYSVPKEKVKSITTPIADIFFSIKSGKVDVHKKYSLPKKFFLYPAQLWPHKNHISIIKALKRIQLVYGQRVDVAFVGSNKGNKDYLEKEAEKLGVKSQVHFLGFVPTDDLISLYKSATGSLYMTFVDAEGLPPAESFVLGCPVIASKINCLIDQTKDAAILVDPLNSDELADAITSILNNSKLRSSLIKKGKLLTKDLKKEKFALKLLRIFDEFSAYRKRWGA